jgi:transcriptional regulator EpsA
LRIERQVNEQENFKDHMNYARDNMMLEGEDPSRLAALVERSLRVTNEQQFFSWVQSEVQYLISHEILICGMSSGANSKMRYFRFSSTRYFRLEHFNEVCDPSSGLFNMMMSVSRKTGRPCALGPDAVIGGCDKEWIPLLESCELRNAAAFGQRGTDGHMKSYFCFARVSDELNPRLMYIIEILVPILEATFSRVITPQVSTAQPYYANATFLSKRETEVLHYLMAGKTNQMIAAEMFLSPLTIKNHVQNIMKKLKVKTRGHAVTLGMKMGLLLTKHENMEDQNG